jgi:hypothetical protein
MILCDALKSIAIILLSHRYCYYYYPLVPRFIRKCLYNKSATGWISFQLSALNPFVKLPLLSIRIQSEREREREIVYCQQQAYESGLTA